MANNHYASLIIWRQGEDGREYLVIEYDSGQGTQIKFPGGTNNDHPGDTVEETLRRETYDETGLVLPEAPTLLWQSRPTPNRDGGHHQKHFFLIEFGKCAGKLRTMPMVDQGGDQLSPPFWRTYEELAILVERGGIFFTHRQPLEEAEKYFRS